MTIDELFVIITRKIFKKLSKRERTNDKLSEYSIIINAFAKGSFKFFVTGPLKYLYHSIWG